MFKKVDGSTIRIGIFFVALATVAYLLVELVSKTGGIDVLSPAGVIAGHQKNLFIFGILLSLIIVLPVFTLTAFIAWKYRASNKQAKYRPDFNESRLLESIWWGVPLILILILSVVTIKSSHDLDPAKPLASEDKQMTIQVVSMNWKWLFIYPDYGIATVNHLQMPINQPVEFLITGDSAMNSFWVPKLGGQIYAMSGMSTKLHLEANETGEFRGSSANISGEGFADMNFPVKVTTSDEFDTWVKKVKTSPAELDMEEYQALRQPTKDHPATFYGSADKNLYYDVIRGYLLP